MKILDTSIGIPMAGGSVKKWSLYRHGPEEASFFPGITYNVASIPQRNEVVNVTKIIRLGNA